MDTEILRLKGDIDLIDMEGAILINAGTSRFTKISGEYVPLVKRIVEMLRRGVTLQELIKAFDEDLDEIDVKEILKTLDSYQVIQTSSVDYGLSGTEQARYRQQINHFTARFPADASEEYIKQLKTMDIFIYGAELLGSRIIQALALLGVGSINILTNFEDVVEDEVYNTTFYRSRDIGKNKKETILKRCKEINPHVKYRVYYENEDQEVLKTSDLVILAFDISNYAAYEEINRFLVNHKRPALLCGFLQDDFFFGPTIIPGETACFSCLEKRCRGNKSFFQEYISYLEFLKQKRRVGNALSARLDLISSFIINEILMLMPYLEKNISRIMAVRLEAMTIEDAVQLNNIFRYGHPITWNNQVTFEFYPQFRMVNNPLLRMPRCAVCGSTADKKPMVIPWSLPLE
ncbi:MAG: ThiF family adenylyltransferase [Candidatus Omnitrophota bacterium]